MHCLLAPLLLFNLFSCGFYHLRTSYSPVPSLWPVSCCCHLGLGKAAMRHSVPAGLWRSHGQWTPRPARRAFMIPPHICFPGQERRRKVKERARVCGEYKTINARRMHRNDQVCLEGPGRCGSLTCPLSTASCVCAVRNSSS